jgi:mono/diheme cytochrome c family protein
MTKRHPVMPWSVGVAALGLMLSACGQTANNPSSVGGVASADTPVQHVMLRDSSSPSQARTTAPAADGSFAIDTSGLTPPFLLKAQPRAGGAVYSISASGEPVDVNQVTTVIFSATTRRGTGGTTATGNTLDDGGTTGGSDDAETRFDGADRTQNQQSAGKLTATLDALKTVLAPLYALYGITNPLTDREAVRAMLRDVRFTVQNGTVTVTNKATGGVIFTGSLSDLASGTFTAANLPGTTPPPPPTVDGAALYAADCAACHGPLATSTKLGATSGEIQQAIASNTGGMGSLASLTVVQIDAIAAALATATPPPPPSACTYGYSDWSLCAADGTQSRTVTASTPAGCTGTPVLTQACTYVPPPPATCSYTYSAWGACQSTSTQSRTVTASTPAGCTGTPVLTQACTFIDGKALYTQYCSGCHGTSKLGSTASAIQAAIDANRGGMGSLKFLTPDQIAAISAAR